MYFEDLTPGRRFITESYHLSQDELIAFAQQFDPQYFHTDPEAASRSVFAGLAASGWHTSCLTMKLVARSELRHIANGLIGMQVDKMRWPAPTRPGDTLTAEIEVLERRRSDSQPGFGVVKLGWVTRNQHKEIAVQMETSIWVQVRPENTAPTAA